VGELTFVLGGTRSGKSRFARDRALQLGGDRVTFIATALPGDRELDERIAAHRRDRPPAWRTVDVGSDLASTLSAVDRDDIILLDSVTLWLSARYESSADLADEWRRAADVLAERARPSIVVSDEIGLGVVPASAAARRFRDDLGSIHQRISARAATVVFCVAGVPLVVKGAS
jgi:adenosylcobinamide kinase/adenosylcobinamide-phosphate guanylyltransferase